MLKYFPICIFLTVVLCSSAGAIDPQTRAVSDTAALRAWLENMVWHHRYSIDEVSQVTGMAAEAVRSELTRFGITTDRRPARPEGKLFVLPYPGGRHPRIGFLDGAIDPQRETKLSVF